MGACCGGKSILNQEIENCKSIEELLALLLKRKVNFSSEREEIKNYLSDNSKEIKAIKFTDLSEISLKKRLGHLDDLEPCYDKYIESLKKYPELSLLETKERLQDLYGVYITMYDDSHTICKTTYEGFENFVKNSAKTHEKK